MKHVEAYHKITDRVLIGTSMEDIADGYGVNESDLEVVMEMEEKDYLLKDVPVEFHESFYEMALKRVDDPSDESSVMDELNDIVWDYAEKQGD